MLASGHIHGSFWTDELVEFVKERLLTHHSRREIARELGVSHNAVCGKAWRLQLVPPGSTLPKRPISLTPTPRAPPRVAPVPAVRPLRPRRRPPRPVAEPAPMPVPVEVRHRPVPFLKRRTDQCAAVLDDRGKDGLALCCGKPTVERKSWCAAHYAIFFDLERMHYGKTR